MGIKILSIVALFIIAMTSIFSTCKKGGLGGCANTVYNFKIGVQAYPDKDSIRVGDTIWFEINTPTTLIDKGTNSFIDYSGTENLGSAIGFEKIINLTTFINSTNTFKYALVIGEEVQSLNPTLFKEYLFKEQNGKYVFKLAVVPKEIGIFGIVFGNAANVYRNVDKCTKASFEINFESTNQHYYLNPNFQGGATPNGGDYYFKVY